MDFGKNVLLKVIDNLLVMLPLKCFQKMTVVFPEKHHSIIKKTLW